LRFVQEAISSRQGRPLINQLASVLVTLAGRMGPSIFLTHEDLTHSIKTHRETVSRALQEVARHGVIRSHHGTIEFVALDQLEKWTLADGH
jgi:CRP-like cAMP-binding protein